MLLRAELGTPQAASSRNPLVSGLWHADFNVLVPKYVAME